MADEIENLIILSKSLKINNLKPLPGFQRSMLLLVGVGVAVSYFKAIALHTNILYAAESLMNSVKETQKNWKDEISEFPMFERTMHLQNAIVTYNNCVDYVCTGPNCADSLKRVSDVEIKF